MRADIILFNGQIHSLDERTGTTSALAIGRDRIIALGSDADVLTLAHAGTIRHNLNGRVVLPGLTDAHIHWKGTAESLHNVRLYDAESMQAAVHLVADRARQTPPGEWVLGYGWSQDAWPGKRFPTAADLDALIPDRPVFLRARSGHAAWVNTLALERSGVGGHTPNPPGGEILRDAQGSPTGILLEWSAMDLVADRIPPRTTTQIAEQMLQAQSTALQLGLTGLHDFDDQECLAALQVLREREALALRVVKNFNKKYLESVVYLGLRWGFGDDWLRMGGLKIFADGAIGPRTAAMIEPYGGEPDNYGVVVTDAEEMLELISDATAAGFPATVHAIGDRAVRFTLDTYAEIRSYEAALGIPRAHRRHRIEHVQIIHHRDAGRLAELNIIASMQPVHATSDYLIADRYWGDRVATAYNPRLQLDQGVMVAFGSDSPYDILSPFEGVYAAIARRRADGAPGPDGWTPAAKVTIAEALRAYTAGPAYAAGLDDRLGRLAPGYLADLIVIDRDPFQITPEAILQTQVVATMVGGVFRYGGL